MTLLSSSFLAILVVVLLLVALALVALAWYAASQLLYPPRRLPATSPGDYGLDAQDITFTSQGLSLRGWLIRAAKPKGTVVICHGYAGDCSPDLRYVPLLRDAGYNTFLFDFRGHGRSEGKSTSLVFYERQDLLAGLDFLKGQGIIRAGLLGFSMGGAIALSTAPLSPMVAGVVADCAFADLHAIVQNAAAARRIPEGLASVLAWLTIAVGSLRLRANLFAADPIHWVGKIAPRPLLIMHGGDDRSVPPENAERLYAAAREPKELWIVPNAAHRRIEEVAAEEYSRRVVEFFDRAVGAR